MKITMYRQNTTGDYGKR